MNQKLDTKYRHVRLSGIILFAKNAKYLLGKEG